MEILLPVLFGLSLFTCGLLGWILGVCHGHNREREDEDECGD